MGLHSFCGQIFFLNIFYSALSSFADTLKLDRFAVNCVCKP